MKEKLMSEESLLSQMHAATEHVKGHPSGWDTDKIRQMASLLFKIYDDRYDEGYNDGYDEARYIYND